MRKRNLRIQIYNRWIASNSLLNSDLSPTIVNTDSTHLFTSKTNPMRTLVALVYRSCSSVTILINIASIVPDKDPTTLLWCLSWTYLNPISSIHTSTYSSPSILRHLKHLPISSMIRWNRLTHTIRSPSLRYITPIQASMKCSLSSLWSIKITQV